MLLGYVRVNISARLEYKAQLLVHVMTSVRKIQRESSALYAEILPRSGQRSRDGCVGISATKVPASLKEFRRWVRKQTPRHSWSGRDVFSD